jgi:predicted  nucleic acid-binding Zn-ribbon protein
MSNTPPKNIGIRMSTKNGKRGTPEFLLNTVMQDYEEIIVKIRKLEIFKKSLSRMLNNGLGNKYSQSIQQRDTIDREIYKALDSYAKLIHKYEELSFDVANETDRLRNINAQRRYIVFDRNVGQMTRESMAAYITLNKQQEEVQSKLNEMYRERGEMQSRLNQLDNFIIKRKYESENIFTSLGEKTAKIHKKIADIEREMSTLEFRRRHVLRQITNQASKGQLRATGCNVTNSDSEDE